MYSRAEEYLDKEQRDRTLDFIRSLYPNENPVPLHAPRFLGNEKKYLAECIDSTYVSYIGAFVSEFEDRIKRLTGAGQAVAMVNGTAALQMALMAAGTLPGDEVITQALTFAATAAGIRHAGAEPAFVDVDRETLGMRPEALASFLEERAGPGPRGAIDRATGRRISAIVPMHTFGHPARIDEIVSIGSRFDIQVVEDSAEALGTTYKGRHAGRFGRAGIFSFNGNKPVTTGGGGMLITDDESLAERARHLSTTAKRKHRWEFYHDEVGYNLRLPNVNAAIGCAQMEYFDRILENKRATASLYKSFFEATGVPFLDEPSGARSIFWLNAIFAKDRAERDEFLGYSNDNGVQTRPAWTLMSKLPPYAGCPRGPIGNAEWLEDRIINIPSGLRP
jgi:perosamine synthetase